MEMTPRRLRLLLNLYPPYLFTRTRVKSISPDWREAVVELKKSIFNRNYVGTAFGGSIYAACDPFHMLLLIQLIGIREHMIWDKGARIEFKKPVRTTLTFVFRITDEDLQKIRADLATSGKSLPEFLVEGIDEEGEVCARITKTVYIRKKSGPSFQEAAFS